MTSKYEFALLDTRSIPAAAEANDKVFATGDVYGVEVTVPALAARCIGNLDPQHSGGDASRAAIEDALTTELPPNGATLATVRADLDAIGAMAILSFRLEGQYLPDSVMARVAKVATADKFARGCWPGKQSLPTKENPWVEGTASAESSCELAAIAAAVSDFKISLDQRVEWMRAWILWGAEPEGYRARVEDERADMIRALESGAIKHSLSHVMEGDYSPNTIAIVESTHRAATQVGYAISPVVVAFNPEFRFQGGEPHAKFTVCQFAGGYVDLKAVVAELNQLDPAVRNVVEALVLQGKTQEEAEREAPKWGGSPTIAGSPQGVSSLLTVEQVADVVAKHFIKK